MKTNIFKQKLSQDVWHDTYKWETDTKVEDTFRRVAKAVASIEKNPAFWEEEYYRILSTFKYVPGGRILSNAGTNLEGTTMVNCFVSGFTGTNRDSIEGIYSELKRQARILKSEGGYGICFDVLRPRGAYIRGIGSESPGPVDMMKLWDTSSGVITSGSGKKKNKDKGKNKIRKGAQMSTLSVWHPSVEEYIVAKQTPGVLSKFNMSVLITDDFMDAVKNHKSWDLIFPDTTFEKYDAEWTGDIVSWKEKGYPIVVYKTYSDANELWDIITTSTYTRNEPGILFIDRANHLNNLHWLFKYDATNPCGEQYLEPGGSCVLGAINISQYVNSARTGYDFEALEKDIPVLTRFQDAINDITNFPLEEQRQVAKNNRRVGIGYMGYGSSLYLLKMAYGAKDALEITDKVCGFITNKIYQASADLSAEKGCFPNYNCEKYLASNFVKQALWPETIEKIKNKGIRNAFLTTCAPTGNTGVFANCATGGVEPVIMYDYIRTLVVSDIPEKLIMPKSIDWEKATCEDNGYWKWTKEGDESILRTEVENTIFKIDRNRGLTREERVYEYAVLEMGEEFWKDKEEYAKEGKEFYGKTIFDLKVEDHISTMAVFAKYIDSAISKTINVPNEYSFEDFKNVYLNTYNTGMIKGITTYRWGTMTSVISTNDKKKENVSERPDKVIPNHAPKRPEVLPCDIHQIQIKGNKWTVVVGKLDGYPFEMFAGEYAGKLPEHGTIKKVKSKTYILECDGKEPLDLLATFGEHGTYAYSKMLSHGVPLFGIIDMCDKMLENILGFNKAMGRILKKYLKTEEVKYMKCTSCQSTKLGFQEGCIVCLDCGYSKCG